MIRTKSITEEEALVLYEMIRNQNEYVMAAYELYCYDNKLDELQVLLSFPVILSRCDDDDYDNCHLGHAPSSGKARNPQEDRQQPREGSECRPASDALR